MTRFPRYHSMRKVLSTRRGRCGEYSILIMRILEQLGYDSRYVADWQDHVWAEVRLGSEWVHVDSCEASIDEPLLYSDWGKNQTHVFSFRPYRPTLHSKRFSHSVLSIGRSDGHPYVKANVGAGKRGEVDLGAIVEDVTKRYTPQNQWEDVSRRRLTDGIDEACLQEAVHRASELISQGVKE